MVDRIRNTNFCSKALLDKKNDHILCNNKVKHHKKQNGSDWYACKDGLEMVVYKPLVQKLQVRTH